MISRAFLAALLVLALLGGPAASAACVTRAPDCASCCDKGDAGCCGTSAQSENGAQQLPDRATVPLAKSLEMPQLPLLFTFVVSNPPLPHGASAEVVCAHSP